jgi:hypothetical protein
MTATVIDVNLAIELTLQQGKCSSAPTASGERVFAQ